MEEPQKYTIELNGKNPSYIENSRIPGGYLESASINFKAYGDNINISFDHKTIGDKESIDLPCIRISSKTDSFEQKKYYNTISRLVASVVGGKGNIELANKNEGPPKTMYDYFFPTKILTDLKIADIAQKISTYKFDDVVIDIKYANVPEHIVKNCGFPDIVDKLLREL